MREAVILAHLLSTTCFATMPCPVCVSYSPQDSALTTLTLQGGGVSVVVVADLCMYSDIKQEKQQILTF